MEKLYAIALSMDYSMKPEVIRQLYDQYGSATYIIQNIDDIQANDPNVNVRLADRIRSCRANMDRVKAEIDWCNSHSIQVITIGDSAYPSRLLRCHDAPLVLFYRGSTPLNRRRIISIVGTRRSTTYGHDFIARFLRELKALCPDVLVVSGLAYGIDICAHREALNNGLDTVGVMAHGLDMVYPNVHRQTAAEMVNHGGILSEFCSKTTPEKMNFVRRNRIVATMADAVILVESAAKGGGLITMGMALEAGVDTFAVPGSVTSKVSSGCNNLIRNDGAELITCAEDLVESMGWQSDAELAKAKQDGIERQMFPQLTPDEQKIVESLSQGDMRLDDLIKSTGLPMTQVSTGLFTLEMGGTIRLLAGGLYHLVG